MNGARNSIEGPGGAQQLLDGVMTDGDGDGCTAGTWPMHGVRVPRGANDDALSSAGGSKAEVISS